MACLSHRCTNPDCDWWDATNDEVDECPECGGRVRTDFDEWDYEMEEESDE